MLVRATMALFDLTTLGYATQIRIGCNHVASSKVNKASKASVTLRGILKEIQIGSGFTCKYQTRLERPARDKHSSLLWLFISDAEKKEFNIGNRWTWAGQ